MAATAAPMETVATQPPSASPAATAYPRWVLLQHYGKAEEAVGSYSTADSTTLATARTSTGHLIGVSLGLAAPAAVSSLSVHFPDGVKDTCCPIIAAHDNSVLIYVHCAKGYLEKTADHFVYDAGAPATAAEPCRPPSLSLLPPYYLTRKEMGIFDSWNSNRGPVQHLLDDKSTVLLRRGEDELVVAELEIVTVGYDPPERKEAKLLLLRSGHWIVKRPAVIVDGDGQEQELLSSWKTHTALPVGDARRLCWVNLYLGLLFWSVVDESPVLQHVPLPVEAGDMEPRSGPESARNVCVTSGGSTVKFVGVFPRCCCDGAGATHCQRSHHAYTINTWTLRMDDMVWVMDGMVDATELWSLDAYEGLTRVPLLFPITSMDDPNTICFLVCEWYGYHVHARDGGDETGWLILVDTRRKTIVSVSSYSDGWSLRELLPSRISCYLDSNSSSSNGASSLRDAHMDTIPSSPVVAIDGLHIYDASDSVSSSCKTSAEPVIQVSVILEVLQEIPSYGLCGDDLQKACIILSQDNGRRFRSVLGLPKKLRKDWLLMEIKATED